MSAIPDKTTADFAEREETVELPCVIHVPDTTARAAADSKEGAQLNVLLPDQHKRRFRKGIVTMELKRAFATLSIAVLLAAPIAASAQYTQSEHDRAKAQQERHDARHHTKAKIVGGSAVGGAVVGGLVGGPKGAAIGAGAGAGGGLLANKARKDNGIKKKEQRENGY